MGTRRSWPTLVLLAVLVAGSGAMLPLAPGLPAVAHSAATARPLMSRVTGLLLTVDTLLDTPDAEPGDGVCGGGPGSCTLRAALEEANASAGVEGITFNIAGSGPFTIAPGSPLPEISDPLILDGTTQPGYAGTPLIVLTGSALAATGTGLEISSGLTIVRGLQFSDFAGSAIVITGAGDNEISGNVFGGNAVGGCSLLQASQSPITLDLGLANFALDDMNDCDQLVGTFTPNPAESARRGFIWLPSPANGLPAGPTDLGTLGGGSNRPMALNDRSEVVGWVPAAGGTTHPFLWLPRPNYGLDAGMHDLTEHGCEQCLNALDINNQGQIVGYFFVSAGTDTTPSESHAYVWRAGTMTDLGMLPDKYPYTVRTWYRPGKGSVATAINERGQIIGTSTCGAEQTPEQMMVAHETKTCSHAVFWNSPGAPTDLGALGIFTAEYDSSYGINKETHDQSSVLDLNNRGLIVGQSTVDAYYPWPRPDNLPHPYAGVSWRNGGGMTSSELWQPRDINDAGDTIGFPLDTNVQTIRWHDGTEVTSTVVFGVDAIPFHINNAGDILGRANRLDGAYMLAISRVAGPARDRGNGAAIVVRDSPDNLIGGPKAADRNVIVEGGASGVRIEGTAATHNIVEGNAIGVRADGKTIAANKADGITVVDAPENTLRGNLIAGNHRHGIAITGAKATGNRVLGNRIGTDTAGTTAISNDGDGIRVEQASGTIIGGTTAADRNTIAANTGSGIDIRAGASGTRIQGNLIGSETASTTLGNSEGGVRITDASQTIVGGVEAGAANIIARNFADGMIVIGDTAQRNTIRGNSIHDNDGLAIDLGGDGPTPNEPDDGDTGPNGLLNFPSRVTAEYDGGSTHITGVISTTNPATVTIDLYASQEATRSGYGEGQRYLGSTMPDAQGNFTFTYVGRLPFPLVSATATDGAGSTSEFALVDTDGDSLPDRWEMHGVQVAGVMVPLHKMGAGPGHKDLFVQADWMDKPGLKPGARAMKIVTDAFARAPLRNPDGTRGVRLHVDLGPDSVMNPATGATWGALSQAGTLPYTTTVGSLDGGNNYRWDDLDALKTVHFDPTGRAPIFHYACFCSSLGGLGSTSGISRGNLPGSGHDFLVTLDGWTPAGGTPLQQAGTFMHELGHNLGLRHGGDDDEHYKPNYLSTMNYSFQMIGLLQHDSSQRVFDYSRRALPTLDETRLDESLGIQDPDRHDTLWGPARNACTSASYNRALPYPALDWDCDGALTAGTVNTDVNVDSLCVSAGPDGILDTSPAGDDVVFGTSVFSGPNHLCESTAAGDDVQERAVLSSQPSRLTGHDDWPAVRFDGGGAIGDGTDATPPPGLAVPQAVPLPPVTPVDDLQTREEILRVVPAEIFNAEQGAPVDVVSLSVQQGDAPLRVDFDGRGSTDPDGTVVDWQWDFGDGAQDTGATVQHTYTAPGIYTARLIVTDNAGKQNLVPLEYRVEVTGTPVTKVSTFLPLVRR